MGAAEHAPLELQVAIKKLELANRALKKGENEIARRLAEEAQVEGELTEAMTRAAQVHRNAAEVRKIVNARSDEDSAKPGDEPASLSQARNAYDQLAADPEVVRYAPGALNRAKKAMERAEADWNQYANEEETKHLAYLADKRIAIARAVTQEALAETSPSTEAPPPGLPEPVPQPALAEASQPTEAQTPVLPEPVPQPALAEAETSPSTEAPPPGLPEPVPQPALAEADAGQLTEPQTAVLPNPVEESPLEAKKREVAALKALNAKQTSRGAVVTLGDVLFDSAGRDLAIEAIRTLMEVATFLHEYPERTVAIEGHTDNIGPEGFNVTVSKRRAQSVQNILLDGGIEQARISAKGYGEAHPITSNKSRAGRQRNRRVELVIQSPNSPAQGRP